MIDAAHFSSIETLRGGAKVEIRSLRPSDRAGLLDAVHRESTRSLYRRFFAVKRNFSESEEDFFMNIDFVKHVALVAEVKENGRSLIVGGCRYVSGQPQEAEVAFSVVDEYQGQGLGTLLMRHLTAIAVDAGLSRLVAEVLTENTPMLAVFEKCGRRVAKKTEKSVVHVTMDLRS
jgi:RimJ/RimL family protein N-acetyltransferase